MSNIETMLIILISIQGAALIFLLFERDRLRKRIDQHEKWLARLERAIRQVEIDIKIVGEIVLQKLR